jgi:hypothetical protein
MIKTTKTARAKQKENKAKTQHNRTTPKQPSKQTKRRTSTQLNNLVEKEAEYVAEDVEKTDAEGVRTGKHEGEGERSERDGEGDKEGEGEEKNEGVRVRDQPRSCCARRDRSVARCVSDREDEEDEEEEEDTGAK